MQNVPYSDKTKFLRQITLFSYFGLLGWMLLWQFVLTQDNKLSVVFILLVYILPLLLPMRGLLVGKPYTHAWTNFVVMFYLMHGLTSIYAASNEWLYALVEILLASCLFLGCSFYARFRGRELGLGLPKLKQEMEDEKAFFESEIK